MYISNVFKNGPDLDLNRHLKKKQTGNVLGKKPRYLLPFCMFKKFFVSTFYTKAVLDTRNLASFYSIWKRHSGCKSFDIKYVKEKSDNFISKRKIQYRLKTYFSLLQLQLNLPASFTLLLPNIMFYTILLPNIMFYTWFESEFWDVHCTQLQIGI